MSAPRPYLTEPFRPLGSINNGSNSYIYKRILVISSMWYIQVCLAVVHTIARLLLQKHAYLWFRAIVSLEFFHMVRAGAYWAQNT